MCFNNKHILEMYLTNTYVHKATCRRILMQHVFQVHYSKFLKLRHMPLVLYPWKTMWPLRVSWLRSNRSRLTPKTCERQAGRCTIMCVCYHCVRNVHTRSACLLLPGLPRGECTGSTFQRPLWDVRQVIGEQDFTLNSLCCLNFPLLWCIWVTFSTE